ncbi:MAG TPA: ferrous iron transport protein A [Firmicutes bacterium]|jgi:Fe2+ transport system protein FeoA|nr:ferrous iron transport protein A [Bacillota bacterium]
MRRGRRNRGHGHSHGRGHCRCDQVRDLYAASEGKCYTVEQVPPAALLSCLGICPNSLVQKKYRYGMGGPVLLQVGSREVAVGKDIASHILVREV